MQYPADDPVPEPVAPAAPAASTETFAQRIRRLAREQGWSEDFERFSDPQLEAWSKYWDEGRQRFRSIHAPEGAGDWAYVEKPTESVIDPSSGDEYGPWGDKVGVKLSDVGGGGGAGKPAVAAPAEPTNVPLWSPLQDLLMNQGGFLRQFDQMPGNNLAGIRGGVTGGSNAGGIWWQGTPGAGGGRPTPSTGVMLPGSRPVTPTGTPRGLTTPRSPTPTGPMTPFTPAPGLGNPPDPRNPGLTPRSTPGSTLTNVLTPLQNQTTGLTGSLLGQPAGSTGLTGLMSKYQKRRTGAWF